MLADSDGVRLRSVTVERDAEGGSCGFHLTRSKWDPYPWVSAVDAGSSAERSGLRVGDCLLEVNGEDVLGRKVSDIAAIVRAAADVTLFLWNSGVEENCSPETICCGPMPRNFQKLTACTSSVLSFLECPICLDTIGPPSYQCDNGHLICIRCRAKTERCPVCRTRLNRGRSLLADQIYNAITDIFELKEAPEEVRVSKMQQIFKLQHKKNVPDIKITPAHTNKFLARIIGKSSSVDNLASNTDTNTNLKTKSLSSTEIFGGSPVVSRSSSMRRIHKNRLGCPTSISCHNSYESLPTEDVANCPFESNCTFGSGTPILDHFQKRHSGPLIQYFKPSFRTKLDCYLEKNNTFVLHFDDDAFYVKIVKSPSRDDKTVEDVHIWSWCAENGPTADKFMTCDIVNKNNTSLINISTPVYLLNKDRWKDIVRDRKGIVVNGNNAELLQVALNIAIKKNSD